MHYFLCSLKESDRNDDFFTKNLDITDIKMLESSTGENSIKVDVKDGIGTRLENIASGFWNKCANCVLMLLYVL